MIEETWELAEPAARHEAFVRRWRPWETELPEADDALSLRLVPQADLLHRGRHLGMPALMTRL